MRTTNALLAGVTLFMISAGVSAQTAIPLYKRADAPISDRVHDLVSRMTLEEKVAQLQGNSVLPPIPGLPVGRNPGFGIVKDGRIDEAVARRTLGTGLACGRSGSTSVTPE